MKKLLLTIVATGPAALPALAAESGEGPLTFNAGLFIWTLITFLVMFALLAKLAFKPIAEALDRRSQTIKQALDDAERSRAEAKKSLDDYQRQLAEARTEAKKIMDEGRALGETVRKEIVEKAGAEATATLQRAQEEIGRAKDKSLQELKDTVAQLSVQIAGKVIEKEVNEATHRQLIDNLIRDLAKSRKA